MGGNANSSATRQYIIREVPSNEPQPLSPVGGGYFEAKTSPYCLSVAGLASHTYPGLPILSRLLITIIDIILL